MSGAADSFLELDNTLACESLEPLEASDEEADTCAICGEGYTRPRLLRCLHTFCEACLQRQHEEDESDSGTVACRRCRAGTRLGERGAAALPRDHVAANLRDMQMVRNGTAVCTSCRTAPPAQARCADCTHFLCAQCLTAHQKSSCFQGHQVLSLGELEEAANKNPVPVHRLVTCVHHPDTQVSLACVTCKTAACEQCPQAGGEHQPPEHIIKRICDVEKAEWSDFLNAIDMAKAKKRQMEVAGNGVQAALEHLQAAHERCVQQLDAQLAAAQRSLTEHHQRLRQRADRLHRQKRDSVWDVGERCQTDREHLEQAIRLADRLLEFGSSAELLQLKPAVLQRVRDSTSVTQLPRQLDITLICQPETVDDAIKAVLGHFQEDPAPSPSASAAVSGSQRCAVPEPARAGAPAASAAAAVAPPPPSRPYSRQTTTISPVEADMPPFNGGYHSLSSPSLPSPINGLGGGSSSGIGSSLSSLSGGHGGGALALGPSPPPAPALTALVDGGFRLPQPPAAMAPSERPHAMYDRSQSYPAETGLPLDLSGSQMALQNIKALARLGSVGGAVSGGGGDLLDTYLPQRGPAIPTTPGGDMLEGYMGRAPPLPAPGAGPNISSLHNLMAAGDASMGRPGMQQIRGVSPLPASPLMGTTSPLLGHNGFGLPLCESDARGGSSSCGAVSPTQRRGSVAGGISSMQIRAKFGQLGQLKGQFNSPHGFCLGADEEIIVADTNNHRIQMFDKRGEFKHSFGVPGKDEGQLWYPRKVAVIRASGKYVVCDRGSERSRMQIFSRNGYFVRKISIRCIDIVAGLAISAAGHIVVVDSVTPTVFVIAENGSLIKWFDCSNYMREPSDIAVNGSDYYICDFKNHCVVVFDSEGQFLRRLGSENVTNFPNGIDVSDAGDVLIGDSHGNKFHVAVFNRNGQLLSEFECPHVKVSRCCGLKLTHEGYIITIAKNNHHVLVLNTLYIA